MTRIKNMFAALGAVVITSLAAFAGEETSADIKLYTLDCGTVEMLDMAGLADDGSLAGQSEVLADPCYLIRHPKGDFLWETGNEQSVADVEGGITYTVHAVRMKTKLTDQLAVLGLAPADVDYMAVSHWHPDHSGNAVLFADATFIANTREHAFMFSEGVKASDELYALFAPLKGADTVLYTDFHDVFGDGSVIIRTMPGHTEGHSILQLNLPEAGTLLFSGDLYVNRQARQRRSVPTFASSKTDLLNSMDAFETLAKNLNARVVIQHDADDFCAMPSFPDFLQ